MPKLVVIVGAGPVGTLLAILLAQNGYRVRILERRPDPRFSEAERGRSINLTLATRGLNVLQRAGVLDRLRCEMVPMRGRQLHDLAGQGPFVPYGQSPDEVIHAISRARLNIALIAAASEWPSIELIANARAVDVDPSSGLVQWRDAQGRAYTETDASFVVAADGAGSTLRQSLASRGLLDATEVPLAHDYKELNIPATPQGRWALDASSLHVWPRGGFMAIAMPNPDGSFTVTLFLSQSKFVELQAPQMARRFFATHFPDLLPLITDFDTEFTAHPQSKLGTVYCEPWHVHRILLIGDAAHAIVPFHGQGLNCGFEDCLLIADLLAEHGDHASAFADFNRVRRPNADAIAAMAIDNYQEMREAMLAPDFVARKELALALERRFPKRFIPRYSMVMFHAEISYSEARRRGALQEGVLDALRAAGANANSAFASQLLDRAEL